MMAEKMIEKELSCIKDLKNLVVIPITSKDGTTLMFTDLERYVIEELIDHVERLQARVDALEGEQVNE